MALKKKLIEVALPLEAISKASAREKSIRHGHPNTLHLWWARRPLAACRAVLFAQLVDDPSSHPDKFPTEEAQEIERERLFKIIEELVIWENSTNDAVLKKAHDEIKKSCNGKLPSVYDPFSGGGSIPLEAQRLGLEAYGSDLNPVAVMIGKAMIEIPPKFQDQSPIHPGPKEKGFYRNAEGLAEDVKYYGQWMKDEAEKRIGHLYPDVDLPKEYGGGKAKVIAWIWARTVPSPDPALKGLPVPLVRSFTVSQKKGKRAWVIPVIEGNNYHFDVKSELIGDQGEAPEGTVNRNGGICLVSGAAIDFPYMRDKAKKNKMGQKLLAVVAQGKKGRIYLPPNKRMEKLALSITHPFEPDTILPEKALGFRVQQYGMVKHKDLFTSRQLYSLNAFSDLISEAKQKITNDAIKAGRSDDGIALRDGGTGALAYGEAVSVYLAFAIDKLADLSNKLCRWENKAQCPRQLFGRHAIPMVWDFAEGNVLSKSSGSFDVILSGISKTINKTFFKTYNNNSKVTQSPAQEINYNLNTVISTDPPYYDNIGYADLSDFFYVWLRRNLKDVYPDLFGTITVPKAEELVATPFRHGSKEKAEAFFLEGMKEAIHKMAENRSSGFPTTIYYAFKQSEVEREGIVSTGWATFLDAVISSGYSICGTWPVRTENASRLISQGTNALASSVVLVCRPREIKSETVTRAEFIKLLKKELPKALKELQKANIAPADLPQASIGPGIGIFSRFEKVLESDDSPMSVKTALQIINRELDEYLTEQEGEFDADTRFAITWFEQNGMKAGNFGDADNLARARGISVESVRHAGIVEAGSGKVRLLKREEMQADWHPDTDTHLTHWECTQYLIHRLETEDEHSAALLLKQMGAENAATARDLAYALYNICDKKGWAKDATSYNGLVAIWSDLTALAATISDAEAGPEQIEFNV